MLTRAGCMTTVEKRDAMTADHGQASTAPPGVEKSGLIRLAFRFGVVSTDTPGEWTGVAVGKEHGGGDFEASIAFEPDAA